MGSDQPEIRAFAPSSANVEPSNLTLKREHDEDNEVAVNVENTKEESEVEAEAVTKAETVTTVNGTKRIKQELSPTLHIEQTVKSPQQHALAKKPTSVFYSPLKTGLVYDVRMRYHAKIFTSYFEYIDPHPEDPRRIYRIYQRLTKAGLIVDDGSLNNDIGPYFEKLPAREATNAELLQVHTQRHLEYIASTEGMTRAELLAETEKGDSIYVNNDSFLSARLACGGSIEACRAVVEGRVKNSIALVRPPGHHAEPDAAGGFCLFSNVAVAAKHMLRAYPESVRRVVIIDWDIHHGNGTQRAFYDDPRVLYMSLHRFENGRFYPGTRYGGADMVGTGAGAGFSVNIPWQGAGVGDADYVYAFRRVVMPIVVEFDPDLVIVSSGFDAAKGDIIGQCHVTPAGYGYLTHMLKGLARGRICVVLEGGYNLDSISNSALGVARVLIGEPPEVPPVCEPRPDTLETVAEVERIQSKYWKCMRPGQLLHTDEDSYDVSDTGDKSQLSVAEPIRAYQAQSMFSRFGFVGLPILTSCDTTSFTTRLPPRLDDIVLASRDISTCHTVVISIHDPPEVWASVSAINGNIDSNTSVVLEHPLPRVKGTVERELEKEGSRDKLGFIDINIPSHMEATAAAPAGQTDYNAIVFAQELLLWVWDNYLNYFSSLKKVVFVGYGDAYHAIVHLYAKRPPQDIKDLVRGTVVFVNRTPLKPLVPLLDESMVDWFYQNSVVFASNMNTCWAGAAGKSEGEENSKRPRKKFGRVLRASVDGLWDVINEKFDEGVDFVLDSIVDYADSDAA